MVASSFASFPSSFSSFPDLDAGPSSRQPQQGQDRDHKKRHKKRDTSDLDSKERKRKRGKHEHGSVVTDDVGRSRKRSEHGGRYGGSDDERLKAEEDSLSKNKSREYHESDLSYESAPLYITDRKGDPLILRYGSLHSGDIPRHHIVGCEYIERRVLLTA